MPKYRKKPIVIEAEQWDGSEDAAKRLGLKKLDGKLKGITRGWFIDTLEGLMHVSSLDWIITGVKGEKYAIKPDIFELSYEKVNDA